MSYEQAKQQRIDQNRLMAAEDPFYKEFSRLDEQVYTQGVLPQKYKELMGLAISVAMRCDECITYHIGGCVDSGAGKEELLEALRLGVIAGGSITYPHARHAFATLKEIGIL